MSIGHFSGLAAALLSLRAWLGLAVAWINLAWLQPALVWPGCGLLAAIKFSENFF